MKSFPAYIKFRYTWRNYQQRVLDEIKYSLRDNRLHVIAPPGSGKTVLGLEIVRFLNRPTLILTPTITIRNQWIQRFVASFFPESKDSIVPKWISSDIKKPEFLTVTTYQALHAAFNDSMDQEIISEQSSGEEEAEPEAPSEIKIDHRTTGEVVQTIREAGFKTVVLDEAHHLRNEWWVTLNKLQDELEELTIVSLTATPPLDVSDFEWERYYTLCGPVDCEVTVPELVRAGNLCPHQDYVFMTAPALAELGQINTLRQSIVEFEAKLFTNERFMNMIQNHPWLLEPQKYIEDILANPPFTVSMIIFLNQAGRKVSADLLKVMNLSLKSIPKWDLNWLEILLTGCITIKGESYLLSHEAEIKEIKTALSRLNVVERGKVVLSQPERIKKITTNSIAKLEAIQAIVAFEAQQMQENLRLAILTDYIHKNDLPSNPQETTTLNKLGVVPIFEKIRRAKLDKIRLGVLSGSMVIIPREAVDIAKECCHEFQLDASELKLSPFGCDENFLTLEIGGTNQQKVVGLITEVFSRGGINVLIGTKSLLGEGWDAPCINTLILASFVGSYMASNQMRGRSMRVLAKQPDKIANIWHIVCVEPDQEFPGYDYDLLNRRFKAFSGISVDDDKITNGIERLGISMPPYLEQEITESNRMMFKNAAHREMVREKWEQAITGSDNQYKNMLEGVKTSKELPSRWFVYKNTIHALAYQGVCIGGFVFERLIGIFRRMHGLSGEQILTLLSVALAIASVVALPKLVKSLWLLVKHGSIEASLQQVGKALLKTMIAVGLIHTGPSKLRIFAELHKDGFAYCYLEGASMYERSIFLDALQEILSPIENPRYLLIRKSLFLGKIRREDYHTVPEIIAKKKDSAMYFHKMWCKYMGNSELIYTRTIEGRSILLKARVNSLAASFQKPSERISCWM